MKGAMIKMIDTSNAKWDFSKIEEYAIKWFNENGFDGKIEKQYLSKTIFTVSKDGVADKFELHQDIKIKSIKKYIDQYMVNWNRLVELNELRKELV